MAIRFYISADVGSMPESSVLSILLATNPQITSAGL